MSRVTSPRLPAAERRQALIEAGLRVFSSGSYAGATTAEIAREAGISEPILYRHFASKRELYIACLDETWRRLRETFEANLVELGEREAVLALGKALFGLRTQRVLPANLWVQALTEAGEDAVIRKHLRKHMKELHDFIAGVIRRAQEAGGVPGDRDPDAEAWIFVAGGLLLSVADRLGGVIGTEDLVGVARTRYRAVTGREFPGRPPVK